MIPGTTRFINDLASRYAWATPEPVGYVEPGWVTLVRDLLQSVDRVMSASSGATLDILDVRERDGSLEVCCVLDGGDVFAAARIREALLAARLTSAETCSHCGVARSQCRRRPFVVRPRLPPAATTLPKGACAGAHGAAEVRDDEWDDVARRGR